MATTTTTTTTTAIPASSLLDRVHTNGGKFVEWTSHNVSHLTTAVLNFSHTLFPKSSEDTLMKVAKVFLAFVGSIALLPLSAAGYAINWTKETFFKAATPAPVQT